MQDWGSLLRRHRRVQGLTQAALAELLAVEQATISRWERGVHAPELGMQRRVRDLLRQDPVRSDRAILHRIQHSPCMAKIADRRARNRAISATAAEVHGLPQTILSSFDYRPFFTDVLAEQWGQALKGGFFAGDIAAVRVVNPWQPVGRQGLLHSECLWSPVFLSDGEILLLSEFRMLDEAVVPEAPQFSITHMEAMLG